jgi:hypothetical protein
VNGEFLQVNALRLSILIDASGGCWDAQGRKEIGLPSHFKAQGI